MRIRSTSVPGLLAVISISTAAIGGNLNPPIGPVAPTPGPEPRTAINAANTPGDADSVFRITQPGSYYLTGNVIGEVGKHGIEVESNDVYLDLMGFALIGVVGSLDGVSSPGFIELSNIVVRNGSVSLWGGHGINLGSAPARGCAVREITARANTGNGIVLGINSIAVHCTSAANSFHGFSSNTGCTFIGCSASGNLVTGFTVGNGCTVSDCTSFLNGSAGIVAFSGSTVTACTAYDNQGIGISVNNGCTVAHCTARLNTLDGISVFSSCLVLSNTCTANGSGGDGAGILVNGFDTRVEGNNCTAADRGIDVDSEGNLIIRNSCSGNGVNWDIVANNVAGPILDRSAPASAAIMGNVAPSSLGTTDPNANFTY